MTDEKANDDASVDTDTEATAEGSDTGTATETEASGADAGSSETTENETPPAISEAEAEPVAPPVDKARRRGKSAQSEKKAADKKRHDDAVAEGQANVPEDSPEAVAEAERKAALFEKLEALDAEVAEHNEAIEKARAEMAEIMAEIYPQLGENDSHYDAVRGYLAASAKERANRAAQPQRIKQMLASLKMSPIDAAFSKQRARGMARPQRKVAKPEQPAGDQE